MSEDFQITSVIIIGTLLLVVLVLFIILAAIKYHKARLKHLDDLKTMKVNYQKEMLTSMLEAKSETMNEVSLELHDNVGQLLTLVKMNLFQVEEESPIDLKESLDTVDKAIDVVRNMAHRLHDGGMQEVNLESSLQEEVDRLNRMGIIKSTLLLNKIGDCNIDNETAFTLIRMVQESISNTLKHAKATILIIGLDERNAEVILSIKDDGIGYDSKEINSGNGLKNLKNRAEVIGARVDIVSAKGEGTEVQILFKNNEVNEK